MDYLKTILLATLLTSSVFTGLTHGQSVKVASEFRIDIDIYDDERKKPISSVRTIFAEGKYIELDDDRHRITIVDPNLGNVTLLDSLHKSRVSFEMSQLESQLNQVLMKMTDDERRKFSSDGEPTLDSGNFVEIGNQRQRYKFRPMTPSNPNIAVCYGDFANWSVRINALFNHTPPFLRMQLNQLLMDQRQLPEELQRITVLAPPTESQPQGKTQVITARLFVNEKLSQEDKTRVATVLKSMNEYTKTSDKEFFR